MSEIAKTGPLEEYILRGGSVGYAKHTLENEFQKAVIDESHPLRKVIETAKNEGHEAARYLLGSILLEELRGNKGGYSDERFYLKVAAMVFIQRPAIHHALNTAIKYTRNNNDELLADYPLKLVQWAAMKIQEDEIEHKRLKFLIESPVQTKETRTERDQKLCKFANEILAEKQSLGEGHNYSVNQVVQKIMVILSLLETKCRNVRRIISKKMS